MSDIKNIETEKQELHFWRTLWPYVKPHKKQLILSMLCSIVVGVAVALQPLTIKWIVDDGILRKDASGVLLSTDEREYYACFYAGIFLLLSVLRISIWILGFRRLVEAIENIVFGLRSQFFRHVQGLCFRFHDSVSSGELYNYIMGSPVGSIKNFLQQGAMTMPCQIVSWFVAIFTLASFNVPMTLFSLLMVMAVVVLNYRSRFAIKEYSSRFMETESFASRYIADMLRGARAVKIYGMENDVSYSFENEIDKVRNEGLDLAKRQQVEHVKPEAVQYLGMGIIYLMGAIFCIRGSMEVGEFLAFTVSINILMAPLMSLAQLNLVRANAEAGLTRIVQVLSVKGSTPEVEPDRRRNKDIFEESTALTKPCVSFEKVHFSYSPDKVIFKDLSIVIPKGQSVALVGSSGSGKTTFISLLMRLYEVDQGEILIHGQGVKGFGLTDLRSAFGVVPQDPFIFQGSILDNLRIAAPSASLEDVQRAGELALLSDFVDPLPEGYYTQVGEGGSQLSGGQKQRIAIARAMLSQAQIYVFDEATSALDTRSEQRIQLAMEAMMKQKTTFIIAHRLTTIRNVDRVLVFEKGAIVQDGRYDELAEVDGTFKELLGVTS